MARNTEINELIFPVWQQPIFLEGQKFAIPGYKANCGKVNGSEKVFAIVSQDYRLVTNEEALNMGKEVHARLFPKASSSSFEVFNIDTPLSKSFCHIDIIDKNYELNIWKQEVYVPFIRVHNSYNRTRPLKFDIGFCRKLCNNGVIYEQDTVSLSFSHLKDEISLDALQKIDVDHLKKLESDFMKKTTESLEIKLPTRFFTPLAAKILERNLNPTIVNPSQQYKAEKKRNDFISDIGNYSHKYVEKEQMGQTAYAFFNVITEYASNNENVTVNGRNGLQSKCGLWINEVGKLVKKSEFTWEKEIHGFEYLLKQQGQ